MRIQSIVLAFLALFVSVSVSQAQWQSVRTGIPDGLTITSVVSSGERLFAGTNHGGYYSDDLGKSWTYCVFPDSQRYPYSRNTAKFFTSGSLLFVSACYEMLVSSDHGVSWQWDTTGFNALDGKENVSAFGSDGSTLYLGTIGGLFQSSENSMPWTPATGDFPNGYDPQAIAAIGQNVFVSGNNPGLVRTSDHGQHWNVVSGVSGTSNVMVAIGSTLFMSNIPYLYATTDTGNSWGHKSSPPSWISCLISDNQHLICGTFDSGVYLSRDLGSTFTSMHDGLSRAHITSLCIFKGYVFAGTDQSDGTYATDQGVWRRSLSDFQSASVIAEGNQQEFVSPNPATNFVTIPHAGHVTIMNMLGMNVLDGTSRDHQEVSLDVSKLPVGTYFVRSDESSTIQKLIKE